MDLSIGNRNQYNGRFNFVRGADGDVAFDDTEAHAVISSVEEVRGSYWADATHGSGLLLLRSLTSRTPSQAEADALDALDPLERANAIENVSATATADRRNGRLNLEVSWSTPSGIDPEPVTVEV